MDVRSSPDELAKQFQSSRAEAIAVEDVHGNTVYVRPHAVAFWREKPDPERVS